MSGSGSPDGYEEYPAALSGSVIDRTSVKDEALGWGSRPQRFWSEAPHVPRPAPRVPDHSGSDDPPPVTAVELGVA
jgi:hypothetical protein